MNSGFGWLLGAGPGDGLVSDPLSGGGSALALEPTGFGLGWLVVFMIVFLGAAALVQRRFGLAARYRGQPELKMIANLPLGDKRAIVMVEAESERMLVGVTAQSVQLISRLAPGADEGADASLETGTLDGEAPVEQAQPASTAHTTPSRRFASLVRAALVRGRR